LLDSIHAPFRNTMIAVDQVYTQTGNALSINDTADPDSVFVPRHNVIQYPYPESDRKIEVVYRATIPNIPSNLTAVQAQAYDVDIPYYALTPVLAYVQARLTSGMVRGENSQAEQIALIKFEQECQFIEREGLSSGPQYTRSDIQDEGWI
jgi:hypothetical protein